MKKQKNQNPLVSIVMPVYNAGDFLVAAIESILKQTYKNFEFIIVDDGSTDNSLKMISEFAKKDKRIKVFKNKENFGIAKTINKAIQKTKGRFIARMDADDIALPKRLEKQVNFLMKNPTIGVLGSQMFEINDKNIVTSIRKVPLTNENIKKNLIITQTIQNPTLMINRKNIPEGTLIYDQKFSPVDDLDMFFRLISYTQFANLPDYLMIYRKHGNNSSLKNIKGTFLLTLKVRTKALLEYGYKTNLFNILINIFQAGIIFSLPENIIYKIFQFFKGGNIKNKNINTDTFLAKKGKKKIDLSLVIPVFKSELFIEDNVGRLDEFLKKQKIKYEIITVVDGKIDESYEILTKMVKQNANLKVFGYKNNQGKGYAVRYGINKTKYSYVGYLDAGFDIDYSSLETIINNVKKYRTQKAFISDKTHPMSITENVPFIRKIYSFIFNKLTNLLVKTEKIDTQVGLKIFKKEVIKNVVKRLPLRINGFAFDIEIIKELIKQKYQICKVPVTIVKEKQSTVTFKSVIQMIIDLFRLSFYYRLNNFKFKTLKKYNKNIKYTLRPIINMFF
ncbi:MAG: glycosyltransferase family 2 protein [Patescibacteria group bacterium]|jgi:glycosyltransferase involved in cell wall biosynthesis